MATLLSKMHSYRPDTSDTLSEYNLSYMHNHLEKPGMNPATVRVALVLLATLTVTLAAMFSLVQLILA